MSQDTAKRQPSAGQTLPNEDLWLQIIDEVNPKTHYHYGHGRRDWQVL